MFGVEPLPPAIVLFEDQPYKSETKTFVARLHRVLRGSGVLLLQEIYPPRLLTHLQDRRCLLVILDLMAAWPNRGKELPGGGASRSLVDIDSFDQDTGLDILRALRDGKCGSLNQHAPVVLRTARTTFDLFEHADVKFCVPPGTGDSQILDLVGTVLGEYRAL